MAALQTTYCNSEFINDTIKKQKNSTSHKLAYKILDQLSDVIVDLSKDDLLELIKNNPFYNKLNKREGKILSSKVNWKNEFKPENTSDEMYFIVPGYIENHKQIRTDYGCLIVSNDDDIHFLSRMNRSRAYSLIVENEKPRGLEFENINSWKEVVQVMPILPVNSIIIVDNFMLSDVPKFHTRKDYSLYSLLQDIVPIDLKSPFHITLVVENGNNQLSKDDADTIILEIKELFKDKEIKVTIIAHTKKATTHERVLLSNYHMIDADKGFSVINELGVQEITKGQIQSVFHDLDVNTSPTTIKHQHALCLYWLKSIKSHLNNHSCYITGDDINRLFQ